MGILQGHGINLPQSCSLVRMGEHGHEIEDKSVTIKSDRWIREQAVANRMIEPFVGESVREVGGKKVFSYGLSSYGYDIRCAPEWKVFTPVNSAIVDPKQLDESCFVEKKGDVCIIPPNGFVLTRSIEYIRVPDDVLVIALSKSSYVRAAVQTLVTPLEPGWEGEIVLELQNCSPLPAKVYANEGIVQLVFHKSDERCETSYADRNGKYQGQRGVTLPRL